MMTSLTLSGALPLLAHRLLEAGIAHDGAGRPDDRPDKEVERLQHVVGIAIDVIDRSRARVMAVADRIDLVHVVAHGIPPVGPRRWRSFPAAFAKSRPLRLQALRRPPVPSGGRKLKKTTSFLRSVNPTP